MKGRFISFSNTCPIDNVLYILHNILSMRSDIKETLSRSDILVCKTLLEVHNYFLQGRWSHGKYAWLTKLCGYGDTESPWDVYGSEFERVVKFLSGIQGSKVFSTCTSMLCPEPFMEKPSSEISLR